MSLICGIDFGPVWCASGARGFFDEGYWFHKWVPGLSWKGSTFVAKTTTLEARVGNMPLAGAWEPKGLFPSCIRIYPWRGHALNAVGLSGPGVLDLLSTERWQHRRKPFQLSFMPVSADKGARFAEATAFAKLLNEHREDFAVRFGLQVNLSCPNTGHDAFELVKEAEELLAHIRTHLPSMPLIAKVNILWPVEMAACLDADAICISNTIPWGTAPGRIDWHGLFGSEISPLDHLGGGGLSGAPLLLLVAAWIERLRAAGYRGHVNACGGILRPDDVDVVVRAGANSVSLGTIAMLRGWRLQGTIKRARKLLT